MKKPMISVCIVGLILFAALPAGNALAQEPMAGGWSAATVTNPEVVAAAAFAIKEEEKILRENKETPTAKLSLVSILSVKQQVVAGMNYRLKLKVTLDGKEKKAEATVWWQAWNKKTPYQLTEWNWQ
jgi:hypothetical protein